MKRFTILLVLALFLPVNIDGQSAFKGCAAEGRGKKSKKNPSGKIGENTKSQNRLKNRDDGPTASQIDSSVALAELLKKSNNDKFKAEQGAEITGYIVEVSPGGFQESCNCSRKDLQDIHINVVLRKQDAANERKHFIVEITPKFQETLGDIKKVRAAIKGKWVTFTGWLFYDSIHADESENTAPRRKGNWRATAWEVHSVSKFKVVPAP